MKIWNRFRLRARSGRRKIELDEEMRLHREMLEEQFVREGMPRSEAARAVAQQFGSTPSAVELSRDEWSFPRFDAMWKDIKFAMRLMRRHPLLTGAAVLTIAFGVGANTAILSVLETVLLNPLGMRQTERVMVAQVHMEKLQMRHARNSGVEFREIHAMDDTFSAVAAIEGRWWTYLAGGQAIRLLGQAVTPDFFRVFDAAPILGRFLTEEDRESVVLSHGMWQAQFGGDSSVIGRAITLDGTPYRIVAWRRPTSVSPWTRKHGRL
jgi:hypothetical protein